MPPPGNYQNVLREFAVGLESLTSAVQDLQRRLVSQTEQHIAISQAIAAASAEIRDIKKGIDDLEKLVARGNGQQSILQRMASLEPRMAQLSDDVEELSENINTISTAKYLGKGQFWALLLGMIVSAVLALGAILSQMHK
jgi:chromosome segregation ATPase